MSKSIFSKIAAVVCSTSTLLALSLNAGAAEVIEPDNLEDGVTNIVAMQTYAEPGEEVKYEVRLYNNTGYATGGMSLYYDKELTPVLNAEGRVKMEIGEDVPRAINMPFSGNLDEGIAAAALNGTELASNNGALFYAYFVVPEDAQPGDKFLMTLYVDQWKDKQARDVAYNAINGWIVVSGGATSTTLDNTTPAPTTTPDPTTTPNPTTTPDPTTTPNPTTTPDPTTTPNPTTTPDPATTPNPTTTPDPTTTPNPTTTVTTNDNGNQSDNRTTTTSATALPTPGGTTTARPGATTTTKPSAPTTATKTGDAGVGLAAAALLAAAGAAVVVSAKKKED